MIVSEHAGQSVIKDVDHFLLVEIWRKGRKLIPWHWDEEAFSKLIGGKADYAAEDLLNSVIFPAIKEKFWDDNVTINLFEAHFVKEGLSFNEIVYGQDSHQREIRGIINLDLSIKLDN